MPGNPYKTIFPYKVIPQDQQGCVTCTALGSGPGLREEDRCSPELPAVCHSNVSIAWLQKSIHPTLCCNPYLSHPLPRNLKAETILSISILSSPSTIWHSIGDEMGGEP